MNEFWLILNPDTFVWTKKNKGMIYNSQNYKSFIFSNKNNISNICKELTNPDNLYGVCVDSEHLKDQSILEFIKNIQNIQAGFLFKKELDKKRPVSYMPILNIQDDIHSLRIKHKSGTQTNEILRNLAEITIHINGDKSYNPLYYKQFTALSNSTKTISVDYIKKFVNKSCKEFIVTLNLVGDFSTYQELEKLGKWIKNTKLSRYNLITNLKSWLSRSKISVFSCKTATISLTVIVDDMELLQKTDFTNNLYWEYPITFCFPICSEQEYHKANIIIENKKISSFEIIPIFNKNNQGFFEKYVYTSLEEIELPRLNKRQIFSNQVINNFFFGKLIVFTNKKVYANINLEPIGNIDNSIYNLIFKELDKGLSWRMIRNKKPCVDCLYQWICPSPSNYELVIGKNNLCHINPHN